MELKDWAAKEINLAKEKANMLNKDDRNYSNNCYDSALKAFETLLLDDYSGFSIRIIKNILNRLLDNKPLTPIIDTDDSWSLHEINKDGTKIYQCTRLFSFWKYVYPNGIIKYIDNDRCRCYDIKSPYIGFTNITIDDIINDIDPIRMPHMPSSIPYKIFCDDFLIDPKNGDYDTRGVLYAIKPNGEKYPINKYFKIINGKFESIDYDTFITYKNIFINKNKK